MATTFVEYTGDGNATKSFSFPSYQESDVKIRVDGVLKTTSTHYNITSYTTTGGGNVVFTSGNIPSSPANIRIYRDTNVDTAKATYTAGSSVKAADLNNNTTQLLYRAQEEQIPNLIHSYDIDAAAIETSNIKDANVTTAKIADSNVTTAKIADSNVTTAKIADNAVTMAKLNSGALPTDVTVASANIVDGTIVEADLSNSAVTSNKIATNAVTATEILNGAVTRDKIAADAIDGTKLADNAVDSEHYTDGSIDRVHLEADIIDSTKLADNAVNSEHYVDGSIDNDHLSSNSISNVKVQDNAINTRTLATNSVTNNEIAGSTITSDKLNPATVITASEQAASTPNDTSFFTTSAADARYFNVSTGDTIKDGDSFPDNDTTIATTAAINDRIVDLVEEVGGFIPIANETSFPTNNPDINSQHGGDASRMSGTIISVKTASTNLTPSGTTVTIANGRGSGLAVIITGVTATIPSGFGFLVETTSTDHTYAFHRLTPKATEVTTVAGSIGNINTVGNAISNVNAVAGNATNINTVAANNTNVTNVGSNISNVNAVHANASNINTVAGINANVTTVAGISSNVTSVAGNSSNINSAVSNASNINSAVSNASNINTVAGSISNVNTTATNIASVNTAASNISNVNNFTDRYQIASNNPSTDGGGNALAAGDLYFNTSANELKVYNGSAWQGGVTASGTFAATTGNTFTGDNRYNDGVKALFGTGSDFQIYHTSNVTFLQNPANDQLNVRSDLTWLRNAANSESLAKFIADGAVELYYDNSKKLETASNGIKVDQIVNIDGSTPRVQMRPTGNEQSHRIEFYNAADSMVARIFGDPSTGNVSLQTGGNGAEEAVKCIANGAVEIYHNNVKKLETYANGVEAQGNIITDSGNISVLNDTGKFSAGTSEDLNIYHNGTDSIIDNNTNNLEIITQNSMLFKIADAELAIVCNKHGGVDLYHDNSKKLETTSAGVAVSGVLTTSSYISIGGSQHLYLQDNGKAIFGAGSDLQIYHDGSINHIKSGNASTNDLKITNTGNFIVETSDSENLIRGIKNGAVELYHDNSKKLETTSTGIELTGNIQIPDGNEVKLGAGGDLRMFHANGNANFIQSYNDNNLRIHTFGTSAQVRLQTNESQNNVICSPNAGVELYYNNVKRFETTANGVEVSAGRLDVGSVSLSGGGLALADNDKVICGSGDDLQIYHDGSNSYIADVGTGELRLRGTTIRLTDHDGSENFANFVDNGAVELFYNNVKKFETISTGAQVTGEFSHLAGSYVNGSGGYVKVTHDSGRFTAGAGDDLQMYHDGSNSYLTNSTGGLTITNTSSANLDILAYASSRIRVNAGELAVDCSHNSSVDLYYDNSRKFFTTSSGVSMNSITNTLLWPYDGSGNSRSWGFIGEDGAYGMFELKYSNGADTTLDESSMKIYANAEVQLFYDNSLKFRTLSTGSQVYGGDLRFVSTGWTGESCKIQHHNNSLYMQGGTGGHRFRRNNGNDAWVMDSSGHFYPAANNTYDIGTTSYRVRNIYTNDLHLSNEGHSNEVDGTWGNWTIQEGESDLFLKNNRSGKKYKFNLTEVA